MKCLDCQENLTDEERENNYVLFRSVIYGPVCDKCYDQHVTEYQNSLPSNIGNRKHD